MNTAMPIMVSILFLTLLSSGSFLNQVPVIQAAEQPRYGGTLVETINVDPPYFNRAISTLTDMAFVTGRIFNSLIQWNTNIEAVPDLAESWETSKDGLAYTFHLVKNATWHDGKPFTSADVKFTIEDIVYKFNPRGKTILEALDRVDTPDAYTAVVRMKYAFPPFLSYVGNTYMPILPKHLYEGTDVLSNPYNFNPVGTGPFRFQEYVKSDHITLVKNPTYFKKGKPYLDRVVLRIIPDVSSRVAAFEKGEVDYINFYGFPNHEYDRLSKLPGVKTMMLPRPNKAILRIDINVRKPPLNNVKVRQAMAYAIDKREILDKAFFGIGRTATGPIPSGLKWAYNPNVPKYELNLTMANKLLDDAGYPKGPNGIRFKTSITYAQGMPDFSKTSEIISLQLREVGIDVLLLPMDTGTQQATVAKWDFDMAPHSATGGPDPSVATEYCWSKNIRNIWGTNTGGYNNSRYDWLHEQALREMDPKKRAEYYFELQEIAVNDLPNFWTVEYDYPIAFKTEFMELPEGATGFEPMDGVWWTKGVLAGATTAVAPSGQQLSYLPAALAIVLVAGVAATAFYYRKRGKKN